MLRIKSFSKSTLQFWKRWVKIIVYLVVYTTFIAFWDTWQDANRSAIVFYLIMKLWYNMFEKISLSSFHILIGVSYCCVALLQLRFFISLENFSWYSNLKVNVQFALFILILMFIMLGCLENFSMGWSTGSVWDVPEIRYGFWEIFKVFKTEFVEGFNNVFIILNNIFSFLIIMILFLDLILLEKRDATFFHNFCYLLRALLKIFKIRPFRFPKKTNTNVLPVIVGYFSCFSSFFLSKRSLALLFS